jgi:hypothetical protein
MTTLAIIEQAKQQEWNIILTVAKNNGFSLQIIHKLQNKIIHKTHTKNNKNKSHTHTNKRKYGPPLHTTVHSYTMLPIYLKILT